MFFWHMSIDEVDMAFKHKIPMSSKSPAFKTSTQHVSALFHRSVDGADPRPIAKKKMVSAHAEGFHVELQLLGLLLQRLLFGAQLGQDRHVLVHETQTLRVHDTSLR